MANEQRKTCTTLAFLTKYLKFHSEQDSLNISILGLMISFLLIYFSLNVDF